MKQEETYLKQVTVFLLLIIYVFGLVKPAIPLVKDVLAHTFFSSSHVATIHYEKGKYHIHLEIKEAANQSDSSPSPIASDNESTFTHIKTEETDFLCFLPLVLEINTLYQINPIDLFQSPPFLPPKA